MSLCQLSLYLLFLFGHKFLVNGYIGTVPGAGARSNVARLRPRPAPIDKWTSVAASPLYPVHARAHVIPSYTQDFHLSQQQEEPELEDCKEKVNWFSEKGKKQLARFQKAMNADENIQDYLSHIFARQKLPEEVLSPVFQSAKYVFKIIEQQTLVFFIQGFQIISITPTNSSSIEIRLKLREGSTVLMDGLIFTYRRELESQMPERKVEIEETIGLDCYYVG